MLPHNHFAISSIVILLVTFLLFPEITATEIGRWIIIGGMISVLIDLDIISLVFLKARNERSLMPFTNPLEIYRKFDLFMDTIAKTGVLKIGLKTHFIFSSLIVLVFYVFSKEYFIPATLGATSHIISDVPNIKRAFE